jgi:hypothetical protein
MNQTAEHKRLVVMAVRNHFKTLEMLRRMVCLVLIRAREHAKLMHAELWGKMIGTGASVSMIVSPQEYELDPNRLNRATVEAVAAVLSLTRESLFDGVLVWTADTITFGNVIHDSTKRERTPVTPRSDTPFWAIRLLVASDHSYENLMEALDFADLDEEKGE